MGEREALSYDLRRNVVDIIKAGGGGHIGGDMSILDVLITLYFDEMNVSPENQNDPDRDRFVLSKGHSVEALYAVLAARGFFPLEQVLKEFSQFGSAFIGHPNNKLPGIEMNSGSLGHGLPVAVGMALAGQRDDAPYRVYVAIGDGELAEGSIWEGAMAASHFKLDNLCAILDRNGLQISGNTEDVMAQDNPAERFAAFGWNVIEVNGHDFAALREAFSEARAFKGAPTILVAHTIKGYGASIMENQASWHHHVPSDEEYAAIIAELAERREAALHE